MSLEEEAENSVIAPPPIQPKSYYSSSIPNWHLLPKLVPMLSSFKQLSSIDIASWTSLVGTGFSFYFFCFMLYFDCSLGFESETKVTVVMFFSSFLAPLVVLTTNGSFSLRIGCKLNCQGIFSDWYLVSTLFGDFSTLFNVLLIVEF